MTTRCWDPFSASRFVRRFSQVPPIRQRKAGEFRSLICEACEIRGQSGVRKDWASRCPIGWPGRAGSGRRYSSGNAPCRRRTGIAPRRSAGSSNGTCRTGCGSCPARTCSSPADISPRCRRFPAPQGEGSAVRAFCSAADAEVGGKADVDFLRKCELVYG